MVALSVFTDVDSIIKRDQAKRKVQQEFAAARQARERAIIDATSRRLDPATQALINPNTGINVSKNLGETYNLFIEHVPSGAKLAFPAFITGFSDAYNVNWNAEEVFGRSDPIATYQNTRRAISVSWQVVGFDVDEATENLLRINYLMSMLYPLYEKGAEGKDNCGSASTINMGPLLRIKFGNLIQDANNGGPLLGYVNGFTVDPELDEGFFLANSPQNTIMGTNGTEYVPKSIRLNFEMTVLHEHSLGWVKGTNETGIGTGKKYFFRGGEKGFPYQNNMGGAGLPRTISVADASSDKVTPPATGIFGVDETTGEFVGDSVAEATALIPLQRTGG